MSEITTYIIISVKIIVFSYIISFANHNTCAIKNNLQRKLIRSVYFIHDFLRWISPSPRLQYLAIVCYISMSTSYSLIKFSCFLRVIIEEDIVPYCSPTVLASNKMNPLPFSPFPPSKLWSQCTCLLNALLTHDPSGIDTIGVL